MASDGTQQVVYGATRRACLSIATRSLGDGMQLTWAASRAKPTNTRDTCVGMPTGIPLARTRSPPGGTRQKSPAYGAQRCRSRSGEARRTLCSVVSAIPEDPSSSSAKLIASGIVTGSSTSLTASEARTVNPSGTSSSPLGRALCYGLAPLCGTGFPTRPDLAAAETRPGCSDWPLRPEAPVGRRHEVATLHAPRDRHF